MYFTDIDALHYWPQSRCFSPNGVQILNNRDCVTVQLRTDCPVYLAQLFEVAYISFLLSNFRIFLNFRPNA